MGYPNSPIGYANPDAVTQIANGLSTTTFQFDNNGNVTQKTVDGNHDHLCLGLREPTHRPRRRRSNHDLRIRPLRPARHPNRHDHDHIVSVQIVLRRVLHRYRSELRDHHGVLVQWRHAAATGTAKTRYVHPDHLGSTNVVTDENDIVVQTLDDYPHVIAC
jgi:hypothetical protein